MSEDTMQVGIVDSPAETPVPSDWVEPPQIAATPPREMSAAEAATYFFLEAAERIDLSSLCCTL